MRYLIHIFLAGLMLLVVGCADSTTDTEKVATPSPQESVAPELLSLETLTEEQIQACNERGLNVEKEVTDSGWEINAYGQECVEMLIQGIEKFPLAAPATKSPTHAVEKLQEVQSPTYREPEDKRPAIAAMAKAGKEYLSVEVTSVTEDLPLVLGNTHGTDGAVTFTDSLITNTHPELSLIHI